MSYLLCDAIGFGVTTDGVTTFINASSLDLRYKPVNKPVIFDLPLPAGVSKLWIWIFFSPYKNDDAVHLIQFVQYLMHWLRAKSRLLTLSLSGLEHFVVPLAESYLKWICLIHPSLCCSMQRGLSAVTSMQFAYRPDSQTLANQSVSFKSFENDKAQNQWSSVLMIFCESYWPT